MRETPSGAPQHPEETVPELPVLSPPSPYASTSRSTPTVHGPVEPRTVERGVIVFDLDGTILDDLYLICNVAADVLQRAFGTPAAEGRVHYLATTGMPFEAQLAQLYPTAPASLREGTARIFHQRKITEAYGHASPFPEVPKLLKRLSTEGWTLVVSTGAETEMAELVLEREGLRYWFEGVLGSGDGTKKEHLVEYQRQFPGARMYLVGDSRFDMESAHAVEGVTALGRATSFPGWTLTPDDLLRWGAAWANYSLADLPEAIGKLERARTRRRGSPAHKGPGRPKRAR